MTTNVSGLPLVTRSMQINLDAPSSNIGVPTLSSCSPDASSSMLARHAQHKAAQKSEPEAPVAATDSGLTPLCLAARLGNTEEVATLLGMGAWCGRMQAVSGDKFDPLALYQLLTDQHGIYHTVASLIVSAFADVWPHRNSLGERSLAHALAGELSEHRQKQKLVHAISSSSATVDNQQIVLMLTHRQVALLAGWCDRALGQ
jgi:hypothetical protein